VAQCRWPRGHPPHIRRRTLFRLPPFRAPGRSASSLVQRRPWLRDNNDVRGPHGGAQGRQTCLPSTSSRPAGAVGPRVRLTVDRLDRTGCLPALGAGAALGVWGWSEVGRQRTFCTARQPHPRDYDCADGAAAVRPVVAPQNSPARTRVARPTRNLHGAFTASAAPVSLGSHLVMF